MSAEPTAIAFRGFISEANPVSVVLISYSGFVSLDGGPAQNLEAETQEYTTCIVVVQERTTEL